MANALQYYAQPGTEETERFVRVFDKFFDCLNVRAIDEGLTKRKPNLAPYRAVDDERLKVHNIIVLLLVETYPNRNPHAPHSSPFPSVHCYVWHIGSPPPQKKKKIPLTFLHQ